MATFNGARYLPMQLRSLCAQDHTAWHLIASDDGSADDTLAILRASVPDHQLTILRGPQQGAALNFWNALMHVPEGSYTAFCDQDDLWHPDKLSRALGVLSRANSADFYTAGRTICTDALQPRKLQRRQAPPGFARTLYRNRAAGNTCLFSPRATKHLQQFHPARPVPFHDWWAALALLGSGLQAVHDPRPVLSYRQHGANILGAKGGRLKRLWDGSYRAWVAANCAALMPYRAQLLPAAQAALEKAQTRVIHSPASLAAHLVWASLPIAPASKLH